MEVNERLDGEPGLVNRSPDDEGKQPKFGDSVCPELRELGWLCKIKLSEPKEV